VEVGRVDPVERDVPVVWVDQAGDEREQGRLSGPVGADDRNGGSGFGSCGDGVQRAVEAEFDEVEATVTPR
jgi:hypothetical protein